MSANKFIDCLTAIAGKPGSHIDRVPTSELATLKIKLWERACSRKRSVSQQIHRLPHRRREQARLPH
ncbi:hypothetical protein DA482_01300 [Pseudomonas fluorescens]|nr:hypothetical protein FIP59_15505 [Pseudomonas fluorescens]